MPQVCTTRLTVSPIDIRPAPGSALRRPRVPGVLTWGALIAAGGSLAAIVTFWMNRGKAEAEALAKADAASATAHAALAKSGDCLGRAC